MIDDCVALGDGILLFGSGRAKKIIDPMRVTFRETFLIKWVN